MNLPLLRLRNYLIQINKCKIARDKMQKSNRCVTGQMRYPIRICNLNIEI